MPEMHFHVRWPDGTVRRCYSPSLVIKDFFAPGESYRLSDFVQRTRTALEIANGRVRRKHGYDCGQAIAELADIECTAAQFDTNPDARVIVEAFEE